jgi:hypothetical protein
MGNSSSAGGSGVLRSVRIRRMQVTLLSNLQIIVDPQEIGCFTGRSQRYSLTACCAENCGNLPHEGFRVQP